MEGILAIIMIFGMPVFIVGISKYFKFRTKRLELEQYTQHNPQLQQQLAYLEHERGQLTERVENLETIVTSVDLELNGRLNRLAAQQSILALPAPAAPAAGETQPQEQSTQVKERVVLYAKGPTGQIGAGTVLLDRFEVDRALGHGGMGAVYLAVDRKVGEQVALKVIASNLAEDPSAVERFRREVSSARKITHPNVIRIHDLQEGQGLMFLSMEYFQGMTLADLLLRRAALGLDEVRPLLAQICEALAAAHSAGVVHRDLKPANVLVNERGDVRVIDFGLAKASYMRSMTATGMIMGTPEYMAPEQVRGQPTDHRTDIYALGALAYHLLCGRPPFTADSPIAIGFMHCTEQPAPPRSIKPELPVQVEAALLQCLAKDPAHRFQTVGELRAALAI